MLWCRAFIQWIVHLTNRAVYPPGWTDCKLYYFLFHFFAHCSSVLLIIMSVEKFIVLYFPLKAKVVCTLRTVKWASFITAFLVIAFDVQFFFIQEYRKVDGLERCVYSNKEYGFLLENVKSIISSYGPFTFMILSSISIIVKFILFKREITKGPGSTSVVVNKSAIRGISTLLLLSITFIILTGPVSIYPTIVSLPSQIVMTALILVQYLNHAVNAVLYCVVGSRFRTELMKTITCCRNHSHSTQIDLNRTTSTYTIDLNTDR